MVEPNLTLSLNGFAHMFGVKPHDGPKSSAKGVYVYCSFHDHTTVTISKVTRTYKKILHVLGHSKPSVT